MLLKSLCASVLAGHATLTRAIDLDITSTDSVTAAASQIASDLIAYYHGDEPGGTPGQLDYPPYYWWESGAMWGAIIDYWYYTGDAQYNNITMAGILWQVGDGLDFNPSNQTFDQGNDDQVFWGMTAMSAAEYNFPDPPSDKPQWLELAQGVWNFQQQEWVAAEDTCAGGLPWQQQIYAAGYQYKNSISNGGFFNLAARLGAYTGNQTYVNWANIVWDWVTRIGLLNETDGYTIWDGTATNDNLNCSQFNHYQWTYNTGIFLLGAATMWNISESANDTANAALWQARTTALIVNSTKPFLTSNADKTSDMIIWEAECEQSGTTSVNGVLQVGNCDTDNLSFKSFLARWMSASTKVAPWTYDLVMPILQPSAEAAAQACVGTDASGVGTPGSMCGFRWTVGGWDNTTGPGQQMDALQVISAMLVQQAKGPVTSTTGGTSTGNINAGTGKGTVNVPSNILDITSADRGGAWTLTVILILMALAGGFWTIW